ncbi:hypothetical protein ACGFNU_47025 [Spirillospora sp. NPDC048911]
MPPTTTPRRFTDPGRLDVTRTLGPVEDGRSFSSRTALTRLDGRISTEAA